MQKWTLLTTLVSAVGSVVAFIAGWFVGLRAKSAELERAEQRGRELQVRLEQVQSESARLQGQLEELERRREELVEGQQQHLRELNELREKLSQSEAYNRAVETRLEETQRNLMQQKELLEQTRQQLTDVFRSLASEVLQGNSDQFLRLAGERLGALKSEMVAEFDQRRRDFEKLFAPISESLGRLDQEVHRIDQERREAQAQLRAQLTDLESATRQLAQALSRPVVRGRWGEIQLRNVVEIAGMVEHCDFWEQTPVQSSDGKLRPDMTIRLPGGQIIVVDSKVPLEAYLQALDASDEQERQAKLTEHARQVKKHIEQLASKAYWDAFERAPEFVVLFLPGEMLFSAALQYDPSLIEEGAKNKVILATPTTLIALLKAVAYGWRQEKLAQNAEQIRRLGQTLHERLAVMLEHVQKLGRSLNQSVEHYNRVVSSFESRVLPAAQGFKELGVSSRKELSGLDKINTTAQKLRSDTAEAAGAKVCGDDEQISGE